MGTRRTPVVMLECIQADIRDLRMSLYRDGVHGLSLGVLHSAEIAVAHARRVLIAEIDSAAPLHPEEGQ